MKKIEAIIRPEALRPLQRALVAAGVPGMSASEVRGLGRQGSQVHLHTGNGLRLDFLRKVRVEIVLDDHQEAEVLRLIEEVNRTGRI
ncbi:MAG: P-II family nitrogen regulator, partial [Vulcanococcus sp.]